MTQVNERKDEMVSRQEIGGFTVKTLKNCAEFIYELIQTFTASVRLIDLFFVQFCVACTLQIGSTCMTAAVVILNATSIW
jgi:hypothetical protein